MATDEWGEDDVLSSSTASERIRSRSLLDQGPNLCRTFLVRAATVDGVELGSRIMVQQVSLESSSLLPCCLSSGVINAPSVRPDMLPFDLPESRWTVMQVGTTTGGRWSGLSS